MTKSIVAIHQPDFMPWLGFFVKVWRADTFVVLDHVKNNVREGSWFRRVRFLASGAPSWISIPVDRPNEGPLVPLNQMTVSQGPATSRLFEKYKRTIHQSYSKAPYFKDFSPLFTDYMDSSLGSLSVRNMAFIRTIFDLLNFDKQIIFSSELGLSTASNQLLIDIIGAVGGKTYLCGDGADGYHDNTLFEAAGISVLHNRFTPDAYAQVGGRDFVPGLSILDALFNLGVEGTRRLIINKGPVV